MHFKGTVTTMTKTTKTIFRATPLGVIVSTILIAGCVAPVGARGELRGVADNNMTDAVRAATIRVAAENIGVADNNMSDATHQATYGTPSYRTRVYPWMTHHSAHTAVNAGVADNNMTDAVRESNIRRAASNAGVADNNMSDATHAATFGAARSSQREFRPR